MSKTVITLKHDIIEEKFIVEIQLDINECIMMNLDTSNITKLQESLIKNDKITLLRTLTRIVEELEGIKPGEPNGKS